MYLQSPQPDYRRLLTTMRHEEPDRVPIAELGMDPPIKAKILGRPVRTVEDDVECWYRAGYDYIYLRPAYEFPHMEELAKITHDAGMPFMYHTDGKLWDVIPDLIALGVDALHPIEPKAMDINEVKRRHGKDLALIGNIDPNTLGLGTPEQVRAEVRQRIKDLAPGGGYAVGIVPVCANYDPASYLRLYQAGRAGDAAGVARAMKRAMQLKEALVMSGPCWLAGIKYAVSTLGIGSGMPVSPLEPAEFKRKAGIRAMIRADGNAGTKLRRRMP